MGTRAGACERVLFVTLCHSSKYAFIKVFACGVSVRECEFPPHCSFRFSAQETVYDHCCRHSNYWAVRIRFLFAQTRSGLLRGSFIFISSFPFLLPFIFVVGGICQHKKRKDQSALCGRSGLCEHKKRKDRWTWSVSPPPKWV